MSLQSSFHPASFEYDLLAPSFDWTFKQIFSDPELLKNFLMSVLKWDYAPIEKIEFLEKDLLKDSLTDKDSRLDLKVITQDKTILNVEIQTSSTSEYVERSLYYWAKIYEGQLSEAQFYNHLNPVVCVNILTKNHKQLIDRPAYNKYSICNDESGDRLTDRLSIHFIELAKFQESWISDNDRNNWLTFMKDPEEVLMHSNHNEHIAKAVEKLQWLSQDPEKRAAYEARQKALRDRLSEIDYERREGREEGREEQKAITARALMKKGLSEDLITEALGVSMDWLEILKEGSSPHES